MFRPSIAPIISSTYNCSCSLWYRSYYLGSKLLQTWLNNYTCFGRPSRPSSAVHKTVVAASGTDHTVWGASILKLDQIRTESTRVTWDFKLNSCVQNNYCWILLGFKRIFPDFYKWQVINVTSYKRDQIRAGLGPSRLKKLAPQTVWSVPEAATTVLCTADDGHDEHPKHVQ